MWGTIGCTMDMCVPADFVHACPPNMDPVAMAGPDQTVSPGDFVLLDGSASTDDDVIRCCALENDLIIRLGGEVRTFHWTQLAGIQVTLEGEDSVTPSFLAPDGPVELVFELTVTDDLGGSNTDQITIEVAIRDSSADAGRIESGG